MKEYLLKVWDFLKVHDFPTLLQSLSQLNWRAILTSALTWLIALPVIGLLIWTKRYKTLIAMASFVAFLLLLQHTLPPSGEQIALKDLLSFLGGAVAIIAVNLYFLLVRD